MPWTHVLANWTHLIEHMCADFKHLELAAMRRFRGNQALMVTYLAETHDLTLSEAEETLDDWLTYVGTKHAVKLAA